METKFPPFFQLSRKTTIEVSGHGLKKKEFEQKAECFTRRLDPTSVLCVISVFVPLAVENVLR